MSPWTLWAIRHVWGPLEQPYPCLSAAFTIIDATRPRGCSCNVAQISARLVVAESLVFQTALTEPLNLLCFFKASVEFKMTSTGLRVVWLVVWYSLQSLCSEMQGSSYSLLSTHSISFSFSAFPKTNMQNQQECRRKPKQTTAQKPWNLFYVGQPHLCMSLAMKCDGYTQCLLEKSSVQRISS